MIDLYFSYRSPYSYLILPRMLKLKNEYNVDVNFKIVYPMLLDCLNSLKIGIYFISRR